MKDAPAYPWKTKVELAIQKAETTAEVIRKKMDALPDDHPDYDVLRELEWVLNINVERLEDLGEIFKEIDEIAAGHS